MQNSFYFVTKLRTSGSIEKHSGQKNMLVKGDEVDSRIVCVQAGQLITLTLLDMLGFDVILTSGNRILNFH